MAGDEKEIKPGTRWLPIGDLAARTGLAVSAIRYYEKEGLVQSLRTKGNQRRFLKADIRRLSFILIAQQLGFSLEEIRTALSTLPNGRTPTKKDWTALSEQFRARLDERISTLRSMRDRLDGCIGCGCLSLATCALYNPADRVAANGPGPRYLLGDEPDSRIQE